VSSNPDIFAITDRIYDAAVGDATWTDVARVLEERFQGPAAIFSQTDRPVEAIALCSNVDEDRTRSYLEHYWIEDVAMRQIRNARSYDIVLDGSLVSPETRRKSGFYSEYLTAVGADVGFYAPVLWDGCASVVVSVQRSRARGDYDADELRLIRALQPHFRRAFRTYRELRRLRFDEAAGRAALIEAELGVVVATARAQPLFVSPVAEEQMRQGGLSVAAGVLRGQTQQATHELHAAVAAATNRSGGSSTSVELPVGEGMAPLRSTVTPVRQSMIDLSGEPLALILLHKDRENAFDADAATRAYGLTPAEGRLLSALVAGRRLGEFAAASGVSITTVKTHLDRLFNKFGVRRQADLIRQALSGVRHSEPFRDEMSGD